LKVNQDPQNSEGFKAAEEKVRRKRAKRKINQIPSCKKISRGVKSYSTRFLVREKKTALRL